MKRAANTVLIHLCSLLIVCPVGWCCWLPRMPAREAEQEADCCCCKGEQKPAPSQPKETPTTPSCCCEPMPAALKSKETTDASADFLPFAHLLVNAEVLVASSVREAPDQVPNGPTLPLHVLHCTWLC